MGWAYGTNASGREIGYSVEAVCDRDGCGEKIDRGLSYVCGGMHDGDEVGCGLYFCPSHLVYVDDPRFPGKSVQVCLLCADEIEKEQGENVENDEDQEV